MHRAVSARLSNPKLSLFDALIIGGFEYENDNDSNAVDSEQIALGQRKNQLSRRVRLARQQKSGLDISESNGMLDKSENSSSGRAVDASGQHSELGSARFRIKPNTRTNIAGNKRPLLLEDSDGGLLEDPAARMSDDATMSEQSPHMAKNHPGYHPILLQQRMTRPANAGSSESCIVNGYLVNQNMGEAQGNATSFPMTLSQPLSFEMSGYGLAPAPSSAAETSHFHSMFNLMPGSDTSNQQLGMGFSAVAQTVAEFDEHRKPFLRHMVGCPYQLSQQQGGDSIVVTNATSRSGSLNSMSAHASSAIQQEKQGPTEVMMASLNQTAASAGLSLEQLAMALRNSNNLGQILASKGTMPTQAQQDLAVSLYQAENRALYQRAMLLAGYSPNIVQDERSQQHLQMAFSAWQAEGRRLTALMNELQGLMDPPLEANTPAPGHNGSCGNSGGSADGQDANASSNQHFTSYNHERNESSGHDDCDGQHHQHSRREMRSEHGREGCAFESGRHHHRLEGRCGHKAILHHPADGAAHIDFVVGNRIECYHGLEPLSSNASQNSASSIKVWPSSYKCEELSCKYDCQDAELECKSKKSKETPSDCCLAGEPKVYNIDDINLDGNEWFSDFSNGDTILGLFKLGADTETNSNAQFNNTGNSDPISERNNNSAPTTEKDPVNE